MSALSASNTPARAHARLVATITGTVAIQSVLGRSAMRHAAQEPGRIEAAGDDVVVEACMRR
jgi:hypothetical protein